MNNFERKLQQIRNCKQQCCCCTFIGPTGPTGPTGPKGECECKCESHGELV